MIPKNIPVILAEQLKIEILKRLSAELLLQFNYSAVPSLSDILTNKINKCSTIMLTIMNNY